MMKTYLDVLAVIFGYCFIVASGEDIYIKSTGVYNYTIVNQLVPPTDFCGELIFDCTASGNAFLALLPGPSDSDPLYEIAFGLNSNTMTYIRRQKKGTTFEGLAENDADLFPYPNGTISLGVSWNNGSITVTTNGVGGVNIISYTDHQPLKVINIAVCTSGNAGEWNFTTPVPAPSGCDVPIEETTTDIETTTAAETTTVPGTTTAVATTSPTSNTDQFCLCPCSSVGSYKWSYLSDLNLTIAEIKILMKDELEEIRQNLTVDKTQTSAYLRTKISAPDGRVSSKSIGVVGVMFLTFVFILVIGADLSNILKNPPSCFRKK